ncbi:MAG: hypothetical protein FWF41_06225 [Betaproteobacteria bacterium]|nr:hypothetical protein [Betaproteobacteria bacterium]
MKKVTPLLIALFAVVSFVISTAHAATIKLEPDSKLEIDLPDNWKSEVAKGKLDGGISYIVKITAPEKERLSIRIDVGRFAQNRMLPTDAAAQMKKKMQKAGENLLGMAVEKQIAMKDLEIKNGFGVYYTITDASLVGKPPKPNDYKTMSSFALYYGDDDTSAFVNILADDANSPAFQRTLKALAGMKTTLVVPGAKEEAMPKSEGGEKGGAVIGFADSRTQLRFPSDFAEDKKAAGMHGQGYFMGRDSKTDVIVSGWFEPKEKFKYNAAKEFWDKEGITRAPTAEITKVNDWDVITYEMSGIQACNVNLRANRVTEDTWVDLHLSLGGEKPCSDVRKRLLAYLKTLQVTVVQEKE